MNKTLLVALHEYKRHASRPRFWISMLLVPLGMLLLIAVSTILSVVASNTNPVGYVDLDGIIVQPQEPFEKGGIFDDRIRLLPFADEGSAKAAVDQGELQGYFVIPKNYTATYKLQYFYTDPLSEHVSGTMNKFIGENLLASIDVPTMERIKSGTFFESQNLLTGKTSSENDWMKMLVPLVTGVVFVFIVLMSGSFLLQAVVEEKENRTMEIMVTSVSPSELMTGKIIGNISIGLTQIVVWILLAVIASFFLRDRFPILNQLELSGQDLAISVLLLLPAFVFTAALMATLGATVTDSRESQQVSGMVIMPIVFPFYFLGAIMMNPNGVIAKVLSYFPLSAPVGTTLRMAFTELPMLELALIFISQVLFAVFTVWLAGKAFRAGMLQYSKRLKLKDIFSKEASHG